MVIISRLVVIKKFEGYKIISDNDNANITLNNYYF